MLHLANKQLESVSMSLSPYFVLCRCTRATSVRHSVGFRFGMYIYEHKLIPNFFTYYVFKEKISVNFRLHDGTVCTKTVP